MIIWTKNGTNIFAILWLLLSGFLIFAKLTGLFNIGWLMVILFILFPFLICMVIFAFLVSIDIIVLGGVPSKTLPKNKFDNSSK